MNTKLKTGIALFIIASLLTFAGAIFKIQHWPSASMFLISGLMLQVPAAIFVVLGIIRKGMPKGAGA